MPLISPVLDAESRDEVDPVFVHDVRTGLTRLPQRELPSKYLYDTLGSKLFEAITLLPEYGLTRADERLLRVHSSAIVEAMPSPLIVAELGSGTGRKTRWLLEAVARRECALYYPIDISAAALEVCAAELGDLESVRIRGIEANYLEGLERVAATRSDQYLLLLFLGSTIGNFDRAGAVTFLSDVRDRLQPGDGMLIGMDLEKPLPCLMNAYDDPAGVTAAFNLNLLGRLNRELGADFNLRRFRHQARYNPDERRIEMHVVSLADQSVSVPAAGLEIQFREGETIWTEACHKFAFDEIPAIAEQAGFVCEQRWVDREWPFAESLFRVVE